MKRVVKLNRLLALVMALAGILLVVKGGGAVRAALAEAAVDNAAILAEDTAPLATDVTAEKASGGKADVMNSLAQRHQALDAREADIEARAQLLAATEKRIDGKIAALKTLEDQIDQLLGKRDEAEQKQITSLVKTYSAMKPKAAARIFNSLSNAVLIPVAAQMKADVLAPVMAAMDSDKAEALTVALAERLKTPPAAVSAAPAPDLAAICTPEKTPPAAAATGKPAKHE
jgi:flagellar motility protein MotE (MotC chaperone)